MPAFDQSSNDGPFISVRSNRHSWLTRVFKLSYVIVFLLIQQGAYVLSFNLVYSDSVLRSSIESYITSIPVMVIVTLIFIDYFGMTHFYRKTSIDMLSSCFKLSALVTLSVTFFAFFFRYFAYPRYVIALSSILMFVMLSVWSIICLNISYLVYKRGKLAIIAAGEEDAKKLFAKAQHEIKRLKINYIGWVGEDDPEIVRQKIRESTEVLVSMNVSDEVKSQIILFCAEKNKTVYMVPQFYELAYSKFRIIQFYDTPTFMIDSIGLTFQQRLFKRVFDVFMSILFIIITLPVQLLVALAIKLDSKGPVFYSQERNTINSRIYNVYKFRTMVHNAEEIFGAYQANDKDPRLTRIGKFLRNMHLDELPQFFNVLKGDISIVGPRSDRPITICEFEERIPGYDQRLKVKAGVTGLAQVMGKYNTDPEDKLRYDMIYIKNYSLLLDIKIVLMTIGAMIPTSKYSAVKDDSDYIIENQTVEND